MDAGHGLITKVHVTNGLTGLNRHGVTGAKGLVSVINVHIDKRVVLVAKQSRWRDEGHVATVRTDCRRPVPGEAGGGIVWPLADAHQAGGDAVVQEGVPRPEPISFSEVPGARDEGHVPTVVTDRRVPALVIRVRAIGSDVHTIQTPIHSIVQENVLLAVRVTGDQVGRG